MTTSINITYVVHATCNNMPKVRPTLHNFNCIAINSELNITNKVQFLRHTTRCADYTFRFMLLPREGSVFLSAFKTDQDRDTTTLHIASHSSMVQFEINIKLSTINRKGLNRLITRKGTRNSAIAERLRDRAAG